MQSRHVSIVIARPAVEVYEYAADPANLPRWAAGLAKGEATPDGSAVVVDSPMGQVRITFAPRNPFGVLDHDVVLPSGESVYNPLQVLNHPEGAEVLFTVRQRDLSDDKFERDIAEVAADLGRLRDLLESR